MTTTYQVKCNLCQVPQYIIAEEQEIRNFVDGMHVQQAFPHHTADERELILSHTCPTCWSQLFENGEEE
jgi:hypothetical protein